MKPLRASLLLAACMVAATAAGMAARPSPREPGSAPRYVLKDTVPASFGTWREVPDGGPAVVNPQTQQLLDKLYSQVVSRTYVNAQGYRVMLSLAYGDDQRGDLQAHKPEVCYPAQGFQLLTNQPAQVQTPFGSIRSRKLDTVLGARREPLTYWFTMGEKPVETRWQQRLVEVRLALTGQVPDGLLFRVSSIDDTPQRAWDMQQAFVRDLLAALPVRDRMRLSGLGAGAAGS